MNYVCISVVPRVVWERDYVCEFGNMPVMWILGMATWIITHLRLFTELSNCVCVQAEMCFTAN